jgi:uncharacterized membrane-anchored protein
MLMKLPPDHPLRRELHDEIHARPPQAMQVPARISHLALVSPQEKANAEREHLRQLCQRRRVPAPDRIGNHFAADFGAFRLKWERHTEFAAYEIIEDGHAEGGFDTPALRLLPEDWLGGLSGALLMGMHILILPQPDVSDFDALAAEHFRGNTLAGAAIAEGAGLALTDFAIAPDGFGRLLIFNRELTPRQRGRAVQRLAEIETYRMMALLAFPVARELRPFLARSNAELAEITKLMAARGAEGDQALLDRLAQLEAAIEGRYADHHYRFSAADAYYDLVRRRIGELREDRLPGLQTFGEFMERRLAPAMNTCRSVSDGIKALAERVEQSTQLLATRVGMVREKQSQALLETMARRAKIQLRLQETVEGLSVAAISYYVVGLVGYAAKGLKSAGIGLDPELVMGLSLPVIIVLAAFGIRMIRKRVTLDSGGPDANH